MTPSLADIIVTAIRNALYELHTGLPAKVLSFDPLTQSCEVQPLLLRVFKDDEDDEAPHEIPPISNVPIVYPAGGGWSITWPLAVGDIVYLTFAERSMDRWLNAAPGELVDPVDDRKHDLSDAVAVPGLRPRTAVVPNIPLASLRLANDTGTTVLDLSDTTITVGSDLGPNVAAVHGPQLMAVLQGISNALLDVSATMVLPTHEGPASPKGAAWAALGAAMGTVTAALAQPPGPTGLLSAKVMVE